jgi:hypothetical protein
MQLAESEGQFQKARSSRDTSLESDSNVIIERDRDPEKQDWQSFSTEEGSEIAESATQLANA